MFNHAIRPSFIIFNSSFILKFMQEHENLNHFRFALAMRSEHKHSDVQVVQGR